MLENERQGVIWALGAYVVWGVLPIYWKWLGHVPSSEIITSRVIWAFVFTMLFVVIMRNSKLLLVDIRTLWQNQKAFWSLFFASALISGNWFLYIWAVNNNHLVETSLGYYINPLISVMLGIFFLKERLTSAQKLAVVIALIGVIILTISYGRFPWLAMALAISFAIYGLMKKTIPLDAVRGLAIETLFILPFALIYYIYLFVSDQAIMFHNNLQTDILLVFTGAATAIPLVLFAKGAQRMPLYMVGFLQYIAPTCMLFLGVMIYDETFNAIDLLSFSLIWLALILFTVSKVMEARTRKLKLAKL
ncbi:EamA family transporter RarD [Paenisporosarcina sp. OV554]|uniref:EamA family transporter RarD n=1 Tax=Paenisporosarcina sp. OV554 TaxID=2135694 RepID=UPI000D38F484|nr:EamA family transporter RarD [Paenisporosarcina sp. OV554]PUB15196.1 chloramphenicol-sensitive protein RarD [Paenisporosarcina sp. OV554]